MSLERTSPRVNVAPVRRISAILLSPVLFAPPAIAGNFPDQWLGDIKLRMEMQTALPGALAESIIVEGVIAFTVISSSITGTGDLTANHRWMIRPCSASGQYPFRVPYTGKIGSQSGEEAGETVDVVATMDEFNYTETLHCSVGPRTRTVERQWMAPSWPSPLLIVDGREISAGNVPGSPLRYRNTAKLITPCEGWDARKEPGPKVKFVDIDPRIDPQPEIAPTYEYTVDQVTERKNMTLDDGEAVRRRALGKKDTGLTFGPNAEDFTTDPPVRTTTPRKTEYAECVSVESVEVHMPIEKIHIWIGSDVGTTGSCAEFAHSDEKWHYDQLWATLQDIANEIEKTLRAKIPGPANAEPRTGTGGEGAIKATIRTEIHNIAAPRLAKLKADGDAHDKQPDEQRRRHEACPGFAPRPVR